MLPAELGLNNDDVTEPALTSPVVVSVLPVISPAVEIDETVTNVGSKIVKPPPITEPVPAFIVLLLVVMDVHVNGRFILIV